MSKQCQFCGNKFTNKSILNKHQKTAKYCLSLRNKESTTSFKCEVCDKLFSLKDSYNKHCFTCHNYPGVTKLKQIISDNIEKINAITISNKQYVNKLEEKELQLEKYEQTIKELQDKLENVAIKASQRPTTRNTQINNYIQQLKPVTDEHLLDSVSNLTIDHIIKGPEGYAAYALEYPLKDRVLCSDYSRRKVKFKNNDGQVITDPEMTTLAAKFFESIKEKNKELICKYANELKEKLGDENVMDTVVKLFDYKSAVDNGSDGGEKTDFHHDFVRQMCSQTLKNEC
jgi:uncharacterized C2H2 Zn-finger protein